MTNKIAGGYYIKARCIDDSEIATSPPHVREIWDWILRNTNHRDKKIGDKIIKRGQCVRTYDDIRNGLKWYIGYRIMRYSKGQCETAMKVLKKHGMITTTKTTRGILINVVNYNKYQDASLYENHTETNTRTTIKPQCHDTINKNDKNDKKEEEIYCDPSSQDPVNKVIDVFYNTINPSIVYGNKTTRDGAAWLIKKFGLDQAIGMAEKVCVEQMPENITPYTPTCTTPYQLRTRLAQWKIYFIKKGKQVNKSIIEEI